MRIINEFVNKNEKLEALCIFALKSQAYFLTDKFTKSVVMLRYPEKGVLGFSEENAQLK